MQIIKAHPFAGLLIILCLIFVGCQEEIPTPDFVLPSPTDTGPAPIVSPTPTPRPRPSDTPRPTETLAAPTATSEPTSTPIPQVFIGIVDRETNQPITGAEVRLIQTQRGFDASFSTLENGQAIFTAINASAVPYDLEVTAPGYQPVTLEATIGGGLNEITVELERAPSATIKVQTANLRAGPGLNFDVVVQVARGEVFTIVGLNNDARWLQVFKTQAIKGWIRVDVAQIDGDLSLFENNNPTPTIEAVTPSPVAGATITPTATTTVTVGAVRPPRVSFAPRPLYEDMVELQAAMVQLAGVLDRRQDGIRIECEPFIEYYHQIIAIQTYRNVPDDWVMIHNFYVNAASGTLDTSRAIYIQCREGGGDISRFNFRNARDGVDFSLERLRIGIIAAEDKLAAQSQ